MNERRTTRPSRLTSLLLTVLVSGGAAHDQLIDGELSPVMAGALLILIFFWSGRLGDRVVAALLKRWLG